MPGRGYTADPNGRRGRAKGQILLVWDGVLRGPALPRYLPVGEGKTVKWHPQTRRWWDGWRRSPQSVRMQTEGDWAFMLETAVLHHRFWSGDATAALSAELRLRQAKFGATPEDRQRLSYEIFADVPTPMSDPHDAVVSSIAARRARLLSEPERDPSLDARRARAIAAELEAD